MLIFIVIGLGLGYLSRIAKNQEAMLHPQQQHERVGPLQGAAQFLAGFVGGGIVLFASLFLVAIVLHAIAN